MKSLDAKLASIHADPHGAKDFILADAKDADMAAGLAATGDRPASPASRARWPSTATRCARSRARGWSTSCSCRASTSEVLTIQERLFDNSRRHARRPRQRHDRHPPHRRRHLRAAPSRPFRTATLDQIQCGHARPDAERAHARRRPRPLLDHVQQRHRRSTYATLEAYKEFRLEAERKGFRHFLEVFDPNACGEQRPADLGRFINDLIVRTLAGVPSAGPAGVPQDRLPRPEGDGGAGRATTRTSSSASSAAPAGTTYDAFKLLEEAKKYGARAALFGRKINNSEHQLTFVRFLRAIADGEIDAEEACRAYHGDLAKLGITPHRPLDGGPGADRHQRRLRGGG